MKVKITKTESEPKVDTQELAGSLTNTTGQKKINKAEDSKKNYEDDFGNEYDFAELEHILNL